MLNRGGFPAWSPSPESLASFHPRFCDSPEIASGRERDGAGARGRRTGPAGQSPEPIPIEDFSFPGGSFNPRCWSNLHRARTYNMGT